MVHFVNWDWKSLHTEVELYVYTKGFNAYGVCMYCTYLEHWNRFCLTDSHYMGS